MGKATMVKLTEHQRKALLQIGYGGLSHTREWRDKWNHFVDGRSIRALVRRGMVEPPVYADFYHPAPTLTDEGRVVFDAVQAVHGCPHSETGAAIE